MYRSLALSILLFLTPLLLAAEEKPRPRKSFIGVQVALGKEENTLTVRAVIPDSPAEKAGLKGGDGIVRINGAKVPADLATAVKLIAAQPPGKKMPLLIKRDGKEKQVVITPDELAE